MAPTCLLKMEVYRVVSPHGRSSLETNAAATIKNCHGVELILQHPWQVLVALQGAQSSFELRTTCLAFNTGGIKDKALRATSSSPQCCLWSLLGMDPHTTCAACCIVPALCMWLGQVHTTCSTWGWGRHIFHVA